MVYRVSRKTFAPSENCRLRLTPLEDFPPAASRHAGKCECTRRFSPAQGKNGRILLLGVKIHLAVGSLANGLAKKDAGGTQDVKHFLWGAFLLLFAAGANAQSKADEEAVRKLPQAFCEAWAMHDGHELAKIMADDVDFVTVATTYLHGRTDFEKFHTPLLSWRFKDSTNTPLQTTMRFLRPDMAVVHWSWRIEHDRSMDGSMRSEPRYGMMTMVAEKRNDAWLVVVAQNTNAVLGVPPELQDIKTPIAIPGTSDKPQ